MKKLLSMLLSVCMLGAFAVSAAQAPTEYTVNFIENEKTVDAKIVCKGEMQDVAQFNVWIKYDASKLEFASETLNETIAAYKKDGKWVSETKTAAGYQRFNCGNLSNPAVYVSGTDLEVATLTFNKLANVSKDDISVEAAVKPKGARKPVNTGMQLSTDTDIMALAFSTTFTAYTPDEPDKPSFVIPEDSEKTGENNGIVDINTNAETGAYSVKVTAPIGKKAVIYIDGVAQTGSEIAGTATKETTIKVAYEDVTDEVITYVVPMSSIYGAEDGIAAFGKGTIAEGVAYGIKFGGLTGTYKDITDYKFPATGNVGGIFGVEVKDAPAGDYTAQAYVGDAMGAAISFTK